MEERRGTMTLWEDTYRALTDLERSSRYFEADMKYLETWFDLRRSPLRVEGIPTVDGIVTGYASDRKGLLLISDDRDQPIVFVSLSPTRLRKMIEMIQEILSLIGSMG